MRKIRILRIAFNDLGHGGIQSRIMVVSEQLKDKIDQDIIVFSSKPAFYDEEFQKYGRIFRCPNYEGKSKFRKQIDYYIRYRRIKKQVYRILKEQGPYDVVHSHTFFEAAPCLAAAKKAGIPVRIAHSHNTAMPDKHKFPLKQLAEIYRRKYRKIILKNATHMLGCSQAAADYLFGKGKGRPVYNSVNCDKFNLNDYPKKDWTELRLIHVGNFLPQKNQLFLVDMFEELKKIKPDAKLIMIGRKGEYLDCVLKKIESKNLGDSISILPHDSNVAEELAKADYFVFPSQFEGFGNVMLEAQAMGLKCFASTEVTTEVDCGLTTFYELERGAKYWAEQIAEYYDKCGAEKHPADMSKFTEENFANEFYEIYKTSVK